MELLKLSQCDVCCRIRCCQRALQSKLLPILNIADSVSQPTNGLLGALQQSTKAVMRLRGKI